MSSTSSTRPAASTVSPSATVRSAGGLVTGKPNGALRLASASVSMTASLAPMTMGASGNASLSAALPPMWSAWPCVLTMAASAQPLLGEDFEDQLRLQARVEHQGVVPPRQPYDIGVLLERLRHDRLQLERRGHEIPLPV